MFGKKDFIKKNKKDNSIIVGINVYLSKEGNYFVAHCPALNISSYGLTTEKAKERFEEEVSIFFEETSKKGTLEKLLLQYGWKLVKKPKPKYEPPKFPRFVSKKLDSFTEKISIPV